MRRLALAGAGMADGVVLRLPMAGVQQLLAEPADHVVVFGMDHHHRAMLSGSGQYVEHLMVVQLQ